MAKAGSSYARHQAAQQAARAAQQAARDARKATRAGQASAGAKGGGGKPAAGRGEQTKAQIQKLKLKAEATPEDTGYEPTGYEPTGFDAVQARRDAEGLPVFSERPVETPDLPTVAQKPAELPSVAPVAPNALNQENAFSNRFNPNPGATPSGHIPLGTPALTAANQRVKDVADAYRGGTASINDYRNALYDKSAAVAPLDRSAGWNFPGSSITPTTPGFSPADQAGIDHYNKELIRMGQTPNTVGGAPIVNGKLMAPTMNELQVAMDNVADLQKVHAGLKYAQHRLVKWRNDPEGALALQPKVDQLEEYLGNSDKLREASLAQSFQPLQQVYNQSALKAAPNAAVFKAQMDAEAKPAQTADLSQPSNTLADRLKKRQGLAWSAPFDVYNQNLPTDQTYL